MSCIDIIRGLCAHAICPCSFVLCADGVRPPDPQRHEQLIPGTTRLTIDSGLSLNSFMIPLRDSVISFVCIFVDLRFLLCNSS